jgi:predicted lipoprotein with Yx(FWY)xxD motif
MLSQAASRRRHALKIAVVGLLLSAGLAAFGSAAPVSDAVTPPTVKVGRDYGNNRAIVVSGAGRALYRRSGERVGRVLCTGICTQKWPPLTVPGSTTRLVKGPGVTGILGKFRRPDGRYQVTLRGYPLYRFSPDHNLGDARGQGQGNVWWTLAP